MIFGVPHLATYIIFISVLYEPGLGFTIDPGMTLHHFHLVLDETRFEPTIFRDSSSLPTRKDFLKIII